MSVSPGTSNTNTLTATIARPAGQTMFVGAHVFTPTGVSLNSVNAWCGMLGASGSWRGYFNGSRTNITAYLDYTVGNGQRNGGTVALDTWTFVGAFFGPFDLSTHDHTSYTAAAVNNDATETTPLASENFTSVKACGEFSTNSNFSVLKESFMAHLFLASNINKTQADALAVEAQTLLPTAFTTKTPEHYWPLISDGVAGLGAVNLTSGGSPTFDGGNNPSLSGGGGGSTSPNVIFI
jgi:hypothetical protein